MLFIALVNLYYALFIGVAPGLLAISVCSQLKNFILCRIFWEERN
jgi:hypothetical protein